MRSKTSEHAEWDRLTLPLPPSLNDAYINRRFSNQRIMTATCRNYKAEAIYLVKSKVKKPYQHLALIEYTFFYPDNRKRDSGDNYLKVLRDCLKGTLVIDDAWQFIGKECVTSGIDRANPRVEVTWVESTTPS